MMRPCFKVTISKNYCSQISKKNSTSSVLPVNQDQTRIHTKPNPSPTDHQSPPNQSQKISSTQDPLPLEKNIKLKNNQNFMISLHSRKFHSKLHWKLVRLILLVRLDLHKIIGVGKCHRLSINRCRLQRKRLGRRIGQILLGN